jgi:hypothetical protein
LIASHGHSLRIGSVVQSLFQFRRSISRPTTKGNIFGAQENSEKSGAARQAEGKVIHRERLTSLQRENWGVHKVVEKLPRWQNPNDQTRNSNQ